MAESNLLVEKRQELAARTKKFQEVMDASTTEGGQTDLSRKEALEKLGATDAGDAKTKVAALYVEIEALSHDVDELSIGEMKRGVTRIGDDMKRPIRLAIPGTPLTDEPRSFGQLAMESKAFVDAFPQARRGMGVAAVEVDIALKTLLQTSAGLQPRTGNGDRIVEKATRPVQLLDFIPVDPTDLFEVPFMEETTRTQAAAEIAEAGTYQEDAFVYTRRSAAVRKVGSQIPITDEQLDDVAGMRSLMDNRLRFGVLAQIDKQILVGPGTGSTIQGIVGSLTGGGSDVSGLQAQAKGADPAANAFFKAMTLVRITGRAAPDLIVMHGTDWQNIRLAQNAQGDYQFGPPSAVGEDTLWGLRVVQSEALTAGTALVGSFAQYCALREKKGVEVAIGFVGTQFVEGKITLRADARVGFPIYRGAAFCKVTGL